MISRAGVASGVELKVRAHMLTHARGFVLANSGHDTRSRRGGLDSTSGPDQLPRDYFSRMRRLGLMFFTQTNGWGGSF